MGEESGRDVQENGPCWSDASGRAPGIGHPPARPEHWASHMVRGAKFPEAPGRGCLRKEVCLYHLKPPAPSLSSQLPDPLPKPWVPHPPASGQPAPPPRAMEALARASTSQGGTRRSPHPGGPQEKQEAASALGRTPGCLGRFSGHAGSLGSQTVNSSDAGYTFSSWACTAEVLKRNPKNK